MNCYSCNRELSAEGTLLVCRYCNPNKEQTLLRTLDELAELKAKNQDLLRTLATERDEWGKKETELLAENRKLREALEKIAAVQLRPELGQIVWSEHYEGAWLDCMGIAKEALQKEEGK